MPTPRPGQPYSIAQWKNAPAKQKKGFKSYGNYVAWWKNNVAPRLPQRTSTSSRSSVNKSGMMPTNALAAIDQNTLFSMAQNQINAQINPLIDHYLKSLDARGKSSMERLRGATQEFVGDVSRMAPSIGAAYDKSEAGMRATNQGIVDFLGKTGQATEGAAQQRLESIGAPEAAIQQQAGTLGSLGEGVTGGALGMGSIEQNLLSANRAADVVEASKYPKYASEYGLNAALNLEQQLAADREEGLGDFRSRIPGLVQETYQDLLDRELQKAIARKGFEIDTAKAKSTTAKTPKGYTATNTPGGTMVYNKDTGKYQFVPGTKPAKKPKAGKAPPLTGISEGNKAARAIHDEMIKKFSAIDRPDPLGPYKKMSSAERIREKQNIRATARNQAAAAINGWLKSVYKGKPESWYHQQSIQMLRAAGFTEFASELEGQGASSSPAGPRGGR